jgi:hypothetical protein
MEQKEKWGALHMFVCVVARILRPASDKFISTTEH